MNHTTCRPLRNPAGCIKWKHFHGTICPFMLTTDLKACVRLTLRVYVCVCVSVASQHFANTSIAILSSRTMCLTLPSSLHMTGIHSVCQKSLSAEGKEQAYMEGDTFFDIVCCQMGRMCGNINIWSLCCQQPLETKLIHCLHCKGTLKSSVVIFCILLAQWWMGWKWAGEKNITLKKRKIIFYP